VSAGHAIFSDNTYLGRCGVNLGLEDGPFTIEMWVQLPDVVAYPLAFFQQSFFSYETESINGWDLLLFNTVDGKIKLHQDGFGPRSTGNAFDLSDGAWHHLAVTREEVENECTHSFYKDGAIVGTNPDLADPLSACRMIQDGGCVVLGQVQNQDAEWVYPGFRIDGFTQDFVGNITELRIWRTSRSQQEIQDKMHVRITAAEQDLVAAWPLDCLHQYDDILGNASFDGMCFAPSPYSLATFEETCPCPSQDPAGTGSDTSSSDSSGDDASEEAMASVPALLPSSASAASPAGQTPSTVSGLPSRDHLRHNPS
jgi:hypothetical protein